MTRAKFYVQSKKEFADFSGMVGATEVVLFPVTHDLQNPESENKRFWTATPNGKITMTITNAEAADTFEMGKQYYVDFTPAD